MRRRFVTVPAVVDGPVDGTWTPLALLNSWAQSGDVVPAYMIDSRNRLYMRGFIFGGAAASSFTDMSAHPPYGAGDYFFHWDIAPNSCYVIAGGNCIANKVGPVNLGVISYPTAAP